MAVAVGDRRHGEGDVDAAAEEPGERVRGRVAALPATVRPGDTGPQSNTGEKDACSVQ